ncbi:MAG: hypothetical protein COW79_02865, partial [Bdellovibrionales bacterium CG22_combo_CG10-13_8_21_14_all_38_13]
MSKLSTLLLCLLSSTVFASDYVVEFKHAPSAKILKKLQKNLTIERFDNFNSDYFKRAYQVRSDLDQGKLLSLLSQTTKVVGIETIDKIEALSITP